MASWSQACSSTSLHTAFGYNEAEMRIEYYLEIPLARILRFGSAARFIEDWVTYAGNHC